jgi:hypothetical protein
MCYHSVFHPEVECVTSCPIVDPLPAMFAEKADRSYSVVADIKVNRKEKVKRSRFRCRYFGLKSRHCRACTALRPSGPLHL